MQVLSIFAALQCQGADALKFLQSQLCSDVEALALGDCQFSGWCRPHGRVYTLGWLWRAEADRYIWFVPQRSAESTLKQLGMFLLRSKAKISLLGEAVVDIGDCRIPGGRSLGLLAATEASGDLVDGSQAWLEQDARQGIPSLGDGERFLPQMLDFIRLGALSLKKGCFPGQEIVARVHYKGEVKRELASYVRVAESAETGASVEWLHEPHQLSAISQQLQCALAVSAKPVPEFALYTNETVTTFWRRVAIESI
jgi:tRNA-modifying protein YgfZ